MPEGDGPLAVLFDMGGTIEDVVVDGESIARGAAMLAGRLEREGITKHISAPEDLVRQIENGLRLYKIDTKRGREYLECSPREIWAQWLLGSILSSPGKLTDDLAEELSFTWETVFQKRRLRPEAKSVLEELARRGYPMGIISNSISRTQVGFTLRKYGLTPYFATVQVSAVVGRRKPDPLIFGRAASALGLLPERCMYVGDTVTQDVLGARAGCYGYVLLMRSPLGLTADAMDGGHTAGLARLRHGTWGGRIAALPDILSVLEEKPWRSL
ncbi:MAG: HAD family hydrolase [Bacteroidota bacterium]